MPKFRKKPVIVEAEQYRPGMEDGFLCICDSAFAGLETMPCKQEECRYWKLFGADCLHRAPYIETLEGAHIVSEGDWIITGVKGERYPCKPDVFKRTYEPVEEETLAQKLDPTSK